jgi:hypothetical protein
VNIQDDTFASRTTDLSPSLVVPLVFHLFEPCRDEREEGGSSRGAECQLCQELGRTHGGTDLRREYIRPLPTPGTRQSSGGGEALMDQLISFPGEARKGTCWANLGNPILPQEMSQLVGATGARARGQKDERRFLYRPWAAGRVN